MANMSYCRFQNTLTDLRDCYDAMNESCSSPDWDAVSGNEKLARNRLIKLCRKIGEEYEGEGA